MRAHTHTHSLSLHFSLLLYLYLLFFEKQSSKITAGTYDQLLILFLVFADLNQ